MKKVVWIYSLNVYDTSIPLGYGYPGIRAWQGKSFQAEMKAALEPEIELDFISYNPDSTCLASNFEKSPSSPTRNENKAKSMSRVFPRCTLFLSLLAVNTVAFLTIILPEPNIIPALFLFGILNRS